MSVKKNILKLLRNQHDETPVSIDLIKQRLGYSRNQVSEAMNELRKEENIEVIPGEQGPLFLLNEE